MADARQRGLQPADHTGPARKVERLLSHAAAVTQGGTIGLSAWQEAATPLSVHEEGQGYSSEDLARLFEPRLENAEEWDPAVIRADVYALQGDLTVESVPGKNAVYTIRLPLQV